MPQIQKGSCPFLALLYSATLDSGIVEALETKQKVTVAAQVLLLCQVVFCEVDSESLHF
jgi:hypothetical protein